MAYSLTLRVLYDRARRFFPQQEIVSRMPGGLVRHTYAAWAARTAQLAHGLQQLGVQPGDRVATLAWNHHRHLEAYFGIALMGATYHTLNLRLPPEQLIYILNHAKDRFLLVDADLLPLILPHRDRLPHLEQIIVMGETTERRAGLLDYESLLTGQPSDYPWPELDEWAPAGICYTSATTGNPKGVVFSHRALYLHTMMVCMVDALAISGKDVLMPVVPMFHVNAWGFPFAAVWMGAKLVLPGKFTPESLAELIEAERVSVAPGVPTIWMTLLPLLDSGRYDLSSLKRIPCGGTAVPTGLVQAYEERGIRIAHAYGLTEGGPITHVSTLTADEEALPPAERAKLLTRQGRPAPGIEQKLLGPDGAELPWDGQSRGELAIRGPWIADAYLDDPRTADSFVDGWYRTGDVATIAPDGTMQIVDRLKDLVKSGGEWISSVELENALMGAPGVAEAAVIGCPHPVWGERPLALVVRREARAPGESTLPASDKEAAQFLRAYLRVRFPSFWVPDQIRFVPAIPKGSTGKPAKQAMRTEWACIYQTTED
jgi:fatty-acyl-CoA synthase